LTTEKGSERGGKGFCSRWCGASNRSLGNIIRKSREDYRALKNNGVGDLWALAWKNLSKQPQFMKKQ